MNVIFVVEWLEHYTWPVRHWPAGATWQSVARLIESEARGDGFRIDGDTARSLKDFANQRLWNSETLPLAALRLIAKEDWGGHVPADTTDEEIELFYKKAWQPSAINLRDGLRGRRRHKSRKDELAQELMRQKIRVLKWAQARVNAMAKRWT
jgi:hypothetical protein